MLRTFRGRYVSVTEQRTVNGLAAGPRPTFRCIVVVSWCPDRVAAGETDGALEQFHLQMIAERNQQAVEHVLLGLGFFPGQLVSKRTTSERPWRILQFRNRCRKLTGLLGSLQKQKQPYMNGIEPHVESYPTVMGHEN